MLVQLKNLKMQGMMTAKQTQFKLELYLANEFQIMIFFLILKHEQPIII